MKKLMIMMMLAIAVQLQAAPQLTVANAGTSSVWVRPFFANATQGGRVGCDQVAAHNNWVEVKSGAPTEIFAAIPGTLTSHACTVIAKIEVAKEGDVDATTKKLKDGATFLTYEKPNAALFIGADGKIMGMQAK